MPLYVVEYIDPILPLITDSKEEIEIILDSCVRTEIKYVFGAILRLRDDLEENENNSQIA